MNYFNSKTRSEQILILVLMGLLLAFGVWTFVVSPVMAAKARAVQAQASAQRDLSIVQAGLRHLAVNKAGDNSRKAAFNRAAVVETAREANILISRVQPEPDDAMKVWFESTPAPTFYAFLTKISQNYKVEISRVNINSRDEGVVSAQVTLVPIL